MENEYFAGSVNESSKEVSTTPQASQSSNPYKPEQGWLEQNYLAKIEGYSFPSASSFLGTGFHPMSLLEGVETLILHLIFLDSEEK